MLRMFHAVLAVGNVQAAGNRYLSPPFRDFLGVSYASLISPHASQPPAAKLSRFMCWQRSMSLTECPKLPDLKYPKEMRLFLCMYTPL